MPKRPVHIAKNEKDTALIAKLFLGEILKQKKRTKEALIVALSGDLGAGKTTFVKAVAKHLGIKNKISSPTFVIMKKYPLKKIDGYKFLFHLDAYRLKNEKELMHLGWGEIIKNKEHLIFIEWPENVKKAIPSHSKLIHISNDLSEERHFRLK
jgi:tRNA threonylcarbamoyladenosine biosynthesis protein TsaE